MSEFTCHAIQRQTTLFAATLAIAFTFLILVLLFIFKGQICFPTPQITSAIAHNKLLVGYLKGNLYNYFF